MRAEYGYERYDKRSDSTAYRTWRILQCSSCEGPALQEIRFWDGADDEPSYQILYPIAKAAAFDLPKEVKKEYEETLKVRSISKVACAVFARRTLEAICAHENATGSRLEIQVTNLLKSDRIPPLIGDMAHLSRKIGNLGAHFAKEEVTEEHIAAMLDFLETILEYLYVAPAKVARVKARLDDPISF